jgi:glycosyltransferase involved in cell wall biosynthesis
VRILFTTSTFPRWKDDTQAPFVFLLAAELVKKGHDVIVLAPHAYGSKSNEIIDGVKIHRFKYSWPAKTEKLCYGAGILPNLRNNKLLFIQVPFFALFHFVNLLKLIYKIKPDILHTHWVVPQGFFGSLAHKITKIPTITTAHGSDLFSFQNGFKKIFLEFTIKNSNALSVNSNATDKIARNKLGVQNTYIIHEGLDILNYSKPISKQKINLFRKRLNIKGPIILCVGRLIKWKGTIYAIKSLPAILDKYENAKLIIVGEGPEREALESEAKKLGVINSTIFLGTVAPKKMPLIFSSANIYLGTSITVSDGGTEGLGIVFLEALASKLPVVATNAGGITDIIKDQETGLIIPEKNTELATTSILKLLEDKPLATKLMNNGFKLSKSFGWNRIAAQYLSLYKIVKDEV